MILCRGGVHESRDCSEPLYNLKNSYVDYRATFYTAPCLTLPKTRTTTQSCYTGVDLANKKGVDLEGLNSEKHLIFACFMLSVVECYSKNGSRGNLPHFKFQLK